MERLGFEPRGDAWIRRKERCGWGFISLPDRCPATVWVTLEAHPNAARCRYGIVYEPRMPGQIWANTDAKALELEIDSLVALLQGETPVSSENVRRHLVRLTFLANLILSLAPASILVVEAAIFRSRLLTGAASVLLGALAGGIFTWMLALAATARLVVAVLNRKVSTRLQIVRGEPQPPEGDAAEGHQ